MGNRVVENMEDSYGGSSVLQVCGEVDSFIAQVDDENRSMLSADAIIASGSWALPSLFYSLSN